MLGSPSLLGMKGRWWASGAQCKAPREVSPSLYVRLGYKMDRCLWGTPKGWNNALEKNGAKGSRFRWGERQGDGNERGGPVC